MPQQVDQCPYCRSRRPHQGPTGCDTTTYRCGECKARGFTVCFHQDRNPDDAAPKENEVNRGGEP